MQYMYKQKQGMVSEVKRDALTMRNVLRLEVENRLSRVASFVSGTLVLPPPGAPLRSSSSLLPSLLGEGAAVGESSTVLNALSNSGT